MNSDLRKLRPFDEMFAEDMGGVPRDPAFAAILDQFWPECFEDSKGQVVMNRDDAQKLEALFEVFGVPLTVLDNSLVTLLRAYDVFSLGLLRCVNRKLRYPDTFARFYREWPAVWRHYIEAVAARDLPNARRLSRQLQPLSPDCEFPSGIILPRREPPRRS